MIVKGSMRYSPSGRLRKNIINTGKKRVEFMQLHADKEPYRRETPDYPSAPLTLTSLVHETTGKQYLLNILLPAYNKGAYQVISKDNVEDIGK